MSEPLPNIVIRACAWLRGLQFGQPDAYNCADIMEKLAREGSESYAIGFRAGAEVMRTEAIKVCNMVYEFGGDFISGPQAAENIRTLPLSEPTKENT